MLFLNRVQKSHYYGDERSHESTAEKCVEFDQEPRRLGSGAVDDTDSWIYATDYHKHFGGIAERSLPAISSENPQANRTNVSQRRGSAWIFEVYHRGYFSSK